MRHFLGEYNPIAGLILLSITVIVLLSSPESIFSNLSIIDTSLYYKSPNEIWVKSLSNWTFIRNETMFAEFPKNIGNWEGVEFHTEEERASRVFMTNNVLIRKYYNGERAIQMVLVKGENNTDVIHPVTCFGRAFNITEQSIESVQPEGWTGALKVNNIYAKRGNYSVVVLYWFMWTSAQRSVKNCIMFMITTPVYYNESDDTYALSALKNFSSEAIPKLYTYQPKSDIIGKELINNFGILGAVIEVLLIGLSLALIFYDKLRKIR